MAPPLLKMCLVRVTGAGGSEIVFRVPMEGLVIFWYLAFPCGGRLLNGQKQRMAPNIPVFTMKALLGVRAGLCWPGHNRESVAESPPALLRRQEGPGSQVLRPSALTLRPPVCIHSSESGGHWG